MTSQRVLNMYIVEFINPKYNQLFKKTDIKKPHFCGFKFTLGR